MAQRAELDLTVEDAIAAAVAVLERAGLKAAVVVAAQTPVGETVYSGFRVGDMPRWETMALGMGVVAQGRKLQALPEVGQ